ncbi:hypothetical protein [Yinghuangia seranimata]|uniref:hypothetical protein n=1 Tax=Yinghuangia seranimata TaxID=408067 RepID=UPI00248D21B2|nr:hypothetical protein [Yinghuangia seranimata]MDI2131457.1 hypothetical protein [Yinghuangia seranimata]
MVDMLRAAQRALDDAKQCVTTISQSNSAVWKGDAGDGFRKDISEKLPGRLTKAATSISQAADHLTQWQTDLAGFQDEAKRLEGDAAAARQKRDTAAQSEQQASGNVDLQLLNQRFDSDAALTNAQQRYDTAAKSLIDARTAANNAVEEFNAIIKRAEELQHRHESDAKAVAGKLDDADDIAPHKPSFWQRLKNQFTDLKNLGDMLAFVGAAAGLAALTILSGGTLAPFLLAGAAALSAGALAAHLADDGMWKKVLTGKAGFQGYVSVIGDAIGAVPGASAVVMAGRASVRAAVASSAQAVRWGGQAATKSQLLVEAAKDMTRTLPAANAAVFGGTQVTINTLVQATREGTAAAVAAMPAASTATKVIQGLTTAGTGYDVASNLGLTPNIDHSPVDFLLTAPGAKPAFDAGRAAFQRIP